MTPTPPVVQSVQSVQSVQHARTARAYAGSMVRYERAQVDRAQTDGPLRFTLSSPGVKRDGLSLDLSRMNLDNFRQNPGMPWMHGRDPVRGSLPIGRWLNTRLEGGKLVAEADFDPGDAFARDVERKYRSGHLSSVSISWIPVRDGDELLEASAVTVPADPDARITSGRSVWLTGAELARVRANAGSDAARVRAIGDDAGIAPAWLVSRAGPPAAHSIAVENERAIVHVLLEEYDLWLAGQRRPPFRLPEARTVESKLRDFRNLDAELYEDFVAGKHDATWTHNAYRLLTSHVLQSAREVPRLGEQIDNYLASGDFRAAVMNHAGGIQ